MRALGIAFFGLLCICGDGRGEPFAELKGGRLSIHTPTMELILERGAIVHVRDVSTGEIFSDKDAGANVRYVPSGAASANDWWWFKRYWHQGEPEKYVEDQRFQKTRRRPTTDSRPKLTVPNATSCRARWRALDNGPTEDALTFEVESVAETGEILLTVVFRTSDKDTPPVSLDVPVLNLKGKSVVLGSGAKYERKDERWVDCTTRVSNGLYSPNVAVIEGDRAVVGIRAEERNFEYANIWLAHTPESDSVILNTTIPYGGRPAEDDRSVLRSVTWRIGVYASWVEAARRWRHLFRTHRGARPLWEQSCEWARGIHAVNTQVQEPAKAQEFYQKLATKLDTEKVLLFYWNGSRVILHGDHRYIAKSARPKPQVIDAFKKHGFRWMGYHGYVLLNPPHAAAARLKDFATKGELPQGYSFQPDYGGPPEDFLDTFRPVSTGYYHPMDKARLWVIHPGTKLCRDYLLRNLDNYCRAHRMDGAYLDILGASSSHQFPPEKKVMEGVDWRTGEWGLLEALRTKHPHLGLMSEYQHERSMPHTFYSWSGTAQVVRLKEVGTRLNHPLRTALWGSFTWTREQEIDPADAALMGTLPDVTLGDDWEVARAKLFTDEELFNDLPEEWGNDALASYRGRDDRWFQFRNLPYGDGFTEVTDAGPVLRLGRFRGVHESPLAQPARIQGWPAYRDGTPAGLNPGRTYPFLLEEHRQDSPFQLTALPGDVFIESISHSENQSVLTFGSSKQAGCEIQIRFHQKCMRIHDSARTVEGPFEEGSLMTAHTTVPGGLVFEWKESATVDTRFRGFISQANGRTRSHGVPDRLWAYNSRTEVRPVTIDGRRLHTLRIGYGRYRGWSGAWASVSSAGNPVLKFELAYAPSVKDQRQRRLTRPLRCDAAVNGAEVWSREVKVGTKWQPVEIPLTAIKGRKAFISLSAKAMTSRDVPASHLDFPALFGDVIIDNNPHSLGALRPDAGKPGKHILADSFEGPEISGEWSRHISPQNGPKGSIQVRDKRLALTGEHYRYLYVSRPFPERGKSIRMRVQFPRTGCMASWNPGIGLHWTQGRYIFFAAGGYRGGDEKLSVRGLGARHIPAGDLPIRVTTENLYDLLLKIHIEQNQVVLFVSVDGRAWDEKARIKRPKDYAKPPTALILGRGAPGKGELFSNDERWKTGVRTVYVDDVVID